MTIGMAGDIRVAPGAEQAETQTLLYLKMFWVIRWVALTRPQQQRIKGASR